MHKNGGEETTMGRKPTVTDEEIIDIFYAADTPTLSTNAIAAEVPIKKRQLRRRLSALEDEGEVRRIDTGATCASMWWVPEASVQVASHAAEKE